MAEFTENITIKQLIKDLKKIDDKEWKVQTLEINRPTVEDSIETARVGGIYQCYKAGPEMTIRIDLIQIQRSRLFQ